MYNLTAHFGASSKGEERDLSGITSEKWGDFGPKIVDYPNKADQRWDESCRQAGREEVQRDAYPSYLSFEDSVLTRPWDFPVSSYMRASAGTMLE
jgi:hypothetical protein